MEHPLIKCSIFDKYDSYNSQTTLTKSKSSASSCKPQLLNPLFNNSIYEGISLAILVLTVLDKEFNAEEIALIFY